MYVYQHLYNFLVLVSTVTCEVSRVVYLPYRKPQRVTTTTTAAPNTVVSYSYVESLNPNFVSAIQLKNQQIHQNNNNNSIIVM